MPTKRKPAAIDYDALRKKRQVTIGAIPPVKIGGKTYALPATLPLSITERFAEDAKPAGDGEGSTTVLLSTMTETLSELFGEAQWDQIKKVIDLTDVPELFDVVFTAYGESLGESSNSGKS